MDLLLALNLTGEGDVELFLKSTEPFVTEDEPPSKEVIELRRFGGPSVY